MSTLRAASLAKELPLALLLGCAVYPGCATATTRSFDGSIYRDGPIAFRVSPPPSSWRPVHVTGASLAYRDEAHDASILINARCRSSDEGTPLVALTNHLLMGSTAREIVLQETVPMDGREALHSKLRAKWDGVPMKFDIYVMKKDACSYDFVYVGSEAKQTDDPGDFESFVHGFHTLPGSGVVMGRHE